MTIVYDNSKAVKINNEMRSGLNTYNQRSLEIEKLTNEISNNQIELDAKNKEIESLEVAANSADKKEAKEANKKLKGLQKDIEKLLSAIKEIENKKENLIVKQNSANVDGVVTKVFQSKTENENTNTEAIGEYKEEESFIPTDEPLEITEDDSKDKISEDDLDIIWNKLHQVDEDDVEEQAQEEITPVYDEPEVIKPVYETEETPVSIFGNIPETVEQTESEVQTETDDISAELDNSSIIEPTVISEEVEETPVVEENEAVIETPIAEEPIIEESPIVETESVIEPVEDPAKIDLQGVETDDIIIPDNESVQDKVHNEVEQEFPKIEVPEPMDSEKKLQSIYEEVDVEPKLLDKSPNRDLKNLTLFVDYNDYTFTFAQQHYNKEALTPEEIESLNSIKSYLNELEFNAKRTIQYNKITAENKRLNRKIVTLSKEFTKTVDKLSKEYVSTTDDLTAQTNKAKEQVEIDRVEKVQTQKLNESLTANIKEQNTQIDNLNDENNHLKQTIENRDETIKELKAEIKSKAEKIKVFEEKLNTVLGIVKEVKNEKKDK